MIYVIFFTLNSEEIKLDFDLITKNRKSQVLKAQNNTKIGNYPLFIEKGNKIEYSFINCKNGPVYIESNSR